MTVATDLPPLNPAQAAHSAQLVERIHDEIERAGGWISFERYMQMALYEPGLGYYSAGAAKLGEAGDFVTAPEISPLFSWCLANQCAEVFATVAPHVLEFGAGSGVMACEVLLELERQGRTPATYSILEVSADLRERQRALLAERAPHLLPRVQWLDAWPTAFEGVVLANEVLDAMPVQRFRIRSGEVNTIGVTWQLGRLDWSEVRASNELEAAVRGVEAELGAPLPDGYASEINLAIRPWVQALAGALQRGVALLIDYGLPRREYYRAERREGTLLCHFRHRFHDDPLVHVGVQDIGAWVDFTAIAEAAADAGLRVCGFTTQAHFLIGAGLETYMANIGEQAITARVQLARQAMLLTLPGEMGERFKVIGLGASYDLPLRGFAVRDLAGRL
jgi:SAM-dependent MidA family methyltransferase